MKAKTRPRRTAPAELPRDRRAERAARGALRQSESRLRRSGVMLRSKCRAGQGNQECGAQLEGFAGERCISVGLIIRSMTMTDNGGHGRGVHRS